MTKILSNFTWLDDIDDALNLANQINQDASYAIDTEFERSRTFYLNPALLQICCDNRVYLVDIAIPEIAKTVMNPIKGIILHSGSEDLELYHQVTGTVPDNVYDTQVAAALSGYGLHASYLNLVKDLIGVDLDKGMSRSDWLARPLSDAQIQYAIEDIAYLDEFKTRLTKKFTEKGLAPLFTVLMDKMKSQVSHDGHAEKLYQKMVKSERLNHADSQKLWLILNWRDELAQTRNKPRNWILNPKQISDVLRKVKTYKDLFQLGLHPNFVKYNGESLLKRMYDYEHNDLKSLPVPIKLNNQQGIQLSEMKQRLVQVCQRFEIEPSMIINTQGLKKLVSINGDLEQLDTWNAIP